MAKKKTSSRSKKVVRKLGKTGDYTIFVTLPKEEIDGLKWRAGQKVTIARSGNKLVIEDWKR